MLVGNDISKYQGSVDWNTYKNNTNFVIIKTSEGVGYIDSWFAGYRTEARNRNIPLGYYHFCRPDLGNSPQAEADFFCSLLDGDPIREGEIIALDFEVTYADCVNWCKQWLDAVSAHFGGMKPLIYLNQSQTKGFNWKPVVDAGYGLWLASYTYDPNKNTGDTGAWGFMALQQWTSSQTVPGIQGNVDGDVFFGDAAAFYAYGYKRPVVIPPTPPPTPPTPPIMPPTTPTTPPPASTPINCCDTVQKVHDTLYGSGWWWVKWAKIKKIVPK